MISNGYRPKDAARTSGAHDGDREPIKMHIGDRFDITEAVPEHCESIVGNEHRLSKFDDVDAVDENFCKCSVLRKC